MKPKLLKPEDLRRSKRLSVNLAAEVRSDWQHSCAAQTLNLSQHGIGVEGTGELLDVVFPNFNHKEGDRRAVIEIQLGLREGATQMSEPSVTLRCHAAYVKRTGENLFFVGLSFHSMDFDSSDRLERYLRGLQDVLGG